MDNLFDEPLARGRGSSANLKHAHHSAGTWKSLASVPTVHALWTLLLVFGKNSLIFFDTFTDLTFLSIITPDINPWLLGKIFLNTSTEFGRVKKTFVHRQTTKLRKI